MNKAAAHHFRITVDDAATAPEAAASRQPLVFEVRHHDDLLDIVERVRAGGAFPAEDAAALALGLKLFTGVMLAHRKDPIFASVQPAMRNFIGNLKSRVEASRLAQAGGAA